MKKFLYNNRTLSIIFYILCFIWLLIYIGLTLSPSSYGIALDAFGVPYHNLFGTARPIRSDEWAVWTPYTQMAVNNHFSRFYDLSNYHIDLRNFNQIPLLDWALVFKPLVWGYFIFSPAIAFSLFYGLMTLLFVIGWKKVTEVLLNDVPNSALIAIIFSFLIYFSSYVQYWWTTTGPILAFTPWLILSLLSRSALRYLIVFYVATCWLLSHTYPPIIITMAYIAIGFAVAVTQKPDKQYVKDYIVKGLVCVMAAAMVAYYYRDAIEVMGSTVYPGKRIVIGGGVPFLLWLSTVFPYIIQNNYRELATLNICEAASGASLLPLLVFCLVKPSVGFLKQKRTWIWLFLFTVFSLWMLFPFPEWVGKTSLFYLVLANRMSFSVGLTLNIFALTLLTRGNIRFTWKRLTILSLVILCLYSLPSALGLIGWFRKSAWELIVIPLLWLIWYLRCLRSLYAVALAGCALFINLLYNFDFNPLLSAKPIFSVINSSVTNWFNQQKDQETGWVVDPQYIGVNQYLKGATLTGIGVNSFSTVLMQPQLKFFRQMYPKMEQTEFNNVFNRYAHIDTSDITQPSVIFADAIRIPLKDIAPNHSSLQPIEVLFELPKGSSLKDFEFGGHIDSIDEKGSDLIIRGWGQTTDKQYVVLGVQSKQIKQTKVQARPDVVRVVKDNQLGYSGFEFIIEINKDVNQPICIVSNDAMYGYRKLIGTEIKSPFYHCD